MRRYVTHPFTTLVDLWTRLPTAAVRPHLMAVTLAGLLAAISPGALAAVTLTAPSKTAGPGMSNSTGGGPTVGGLVTINVPVTLKQPLPANGECPVAVAPGGEPNFALDFYEYDLADPNDCMGVDTTQKGTVAIP
jgi:hypothetical protein